MKNRRAAWILLIGTIVFGLVVGELVLGYLMRSKFKRPLVYAESEYTSFTLVPDLVEAHNSREFQVVYEINSEGYRGAPVTLPKPEGVQHVLLTGDSFAFGHGVMGDETVSERLEARLREAGEEVEVVNAGFMAGTAPDDAYAFLSSPRAEALEPDAVIELIFVQNDIRDVAEHEWPKLDARGLPLQVVNPTGGPNELHGRGPVPWHMSNPLFRNSGIVAFAGRVWFAFGLLPERAETMKKWRAEYREANDGVSERFAKVIGGLDALTQEKGWAFMVGIIPATAQVLGEEAPLYDEALARIRRELDARGVPYVIFDGEGAGITSDDLYALDSHWKATGHDKAAAALQALWPRRKRPAPAEPSEAAPSSEAAPAP